MSQRRAFNGIEASVIQLRHVMYVPITSVFDSVRDNATNECLADMRLQLLYFLWDNEVESVMQITRVGAEWRRFG